MEELEEEILEEDIEEEIPLEYRDLDRIPTSKNAIDADISWDHVAKIALCDAINNLAEAMNKNRV